MVISMGLWGFWKRKTKRKQFSAEAMSAEVGKTMQAAIGTGEATVKGSGEQEEEGFRFDRERHKPVIRSSICTGEQVAGFKDRHTGRFTEIMMVRNNEDIEEFTHKYGVSREEITREW